MKRNIWLCAALGALLLCASRAGAVTTTFAETQTITLANPAPLEDLGFSLAASDGLLIAGAVNSKNASNVSVGSAYVYRRQPDGSFNQVAQLRPNDGELNDAFGWGVGFDGNTAIIEAKFHDGPSSGDGTVYIFHRTSDAVWEQVGEFFPPALNRYSAVDVSGSIAVASRNYHVIGTNHGFVDIFRKSSAGDWTAVQVIALPGVQSVVNDIAIEGGTLMIGGFASAPTTYSVEVYEDTPAGFVPTSTILPDVPTGSTTFGTSVELENDRLLVGDRNAAPYGLTFVFERNGADQWLQTARLEPTALDQTSTFGYKLALDGDRAIINSSTGPSDFIGGMVHVYEKQPGGNWDRVAKLSSLNAVETFGFDLEAMDGQVFVSSEVNSPGKIHVFSEVPEPSCTALVGMLALARFARRKRNSIRAI
jgi:hypothetical protein